MLSRETVTVSQLAVESKFLFVVSHLICEGKG